MPLIHSSEVVVSRFHYVWIMGPYLSRKMRGQVASKKRTLLDQKETACEITAPP